MASVHVNDITHSGMLMLSFSCSGDYVEIANVAVGTCADACAHNVL